MEAFSEPLAGVEKLLFALVWLAPFGIWKLVELLILLVRHFR